MTNKGMPKSLWNTGQKVNVLRRGKRNILEDINSQRWVKINKKMYKYPQEVEY